MILAQSLYINKEVNTLLKVHDICETMKVFSPFWSFISQKLLVLESNFL